MDWGHIVWPLGFGGFGCPDGLGYLRGCELNFLFIQLVELPGDEMVGL